MPKYKKRKYGRRKRYRRKRKSRSVRSVARQVVRREMRKNVEVKHAIGNLALRDVPNAGESVSLTITTVQGVGSGMRVGDKIKMKRLQANVFIQGPVFAALPIQTTPCFVRAILWYAKGKLHPAVAHMTGGAWNKFTQWALIDKEHRPYIIWDKVFQLGAKSRVQPAGGAALTYTFQAANQAKCYRYLKINKKFNFEQEYTGGTFTGGDIVLTMITNYAADLPKYSCEMKMWYTDQ